MKKFAYGFVALSAFLFAACSSDNVPEAPENQTPEQEQAGVEKCSDPVKVVLLDPQSRATSTLDPEITNLTATRCDGENIYNHKYYLVSYHGRNGAENGMVQSINTSGQVVSEIYFPDSRLNYVQSCTDGNVFVAVDRKGGLDTKGEGKTFCGIVVVKMGTDGKFILPEGAEENGILPYKVPGLSVNCIKQDNANAIVVATAGNEGLEVAGKSGFIKYAVSNYALTDILKDETAENYRGYWVSQGSTFLMTYVYRTYNYETNKLEFWLGVSEDRNTFRNTPKLFEEYGTAKVKVHEQDNFVNKGRFATISFAVNGKDFVLVSTGTKEGGLQVYRYDRNTDELTLTDTWHKVTCNSSSEFTNNGKTYCFAACADGGVYKLECVPNGDNLYLKPIWKRLPATFTEDGAEKTASTNYVQTMDSKLHVCGGYEGYYTLEYGDTGEGKIAADKRTDISEEVAAILYPAPAE